MTTADERLDVAELSIDVAIDLVPIISREVADHDDRRLLIDDIVTRWRTLDQHTREKFRHPNSPRSRLSWYTSAYVDTVEAEEHPDLPNHYDAAMHILWQRHVQRLRDNHPWNPIIS